MDIELRELSAIYLENLQEEEEGGDEGGGADVGAHAKAIRYQARRDGVPLPKAFNDYVAKNQLSGTERTALRQKLGFMEEVEVLDEKKGCNHTHKGEECEVHGNKECPVEEAADYKDRDKVLNKAKPLHKHLYKNLHKGDTEGDVNESRYSSWREDLREIVDSSEKPETDTKAGEKIVEKKVKNKIVINPPMGMKEAIEALGGTIIEMVEVDEATYGGTPKKKEEPKDTRMVVTSADKKGNTPAYQRMKAGDKRYKAADHMGEGVTPEEKMQKKQLQSKEMMMKKQHLLDKQRMQAQKSLRMPTSKMEETEDSLRDKRMERGGVDGNTRYDKAPKFAPGPAKKKSSGGMSALDRVKADIRAKYGQGAIIDTKKKG